MGKLSLRRGKDDAPQVTGTDGAEALQVHGTVGASAEAADAPEPDGKPKLAPDGRLREVSLLVEEADYLLQLYRWIVLTAEVPRAQDWLKREQWPHPDYVIDVFGSWDKFLAHA